MSSLLAELKNGNLKHVYRARKFLHKHIIINRTVWGNKQHEFINAEVYESIDGNKYLLLFPAITEHDDYIMYERFEYTKNCLEKLRHKMNIQSGEIIFKNFSISYKELKIKLKNVNSYSEGMQSSVMEDILHRESILHIVHRSALVYKGLNSYFKDIVNREFSLSESIDVDEDYKQLQDAYLSDGRAFIDNFVEATCLG